MKYTSLLIIIVFIGCSSNLPYIDVDDVIQLDYGMSTTEVKNLLGKPIKISGNQDEELWLYEYRVLENSRFEWQSPVKGDNPILIGGTSPFYCKFNNNKLIEIESCFEGCTEQSISNNASFISKYKWPIMIGAGLAILMPIILNEFEDDDDYYEGDDW